MGRSDPRVGVYCLALGGAEQTSSAGTPLNALNTVAQFTWDLRLERTQSGPQAAKSTGKHRGRPSMHSEKHTQRVARGSSQKNERFSYRP